MMRLTIEITITPAETIINGDTLLGFMDSELSLFENIEQALIKHGIAHNVTLVVENNHIAHKLALLDGITDLDRVFNVTYNVQSKLKATYIKKSKLEWENIWNDLKLVRDSGGRWCCGSDTLPFVVEYCKQFRTPSRAWPNSYAAPLLTMTFAKALTENEPVLAIKLKIAE